MLREATGIRKIYLRAGRTDLRKGIYSLQAMIQMETGISPLEEGTMFLFCGKRVSRKIKVPGIGNKIPHFQKGRSPKSERDML